MLVQATLCIIVQFALSKAWIINNIDSNILAKRLNYKLDGIDENEAAMLKRFSLIYPGTKWCGMGNSAEDYDDLGVERETDMCCRAHDHCPDLIPAFSSKYNLTNRMFYTRLSCDCDMKFYRCLKSARASAANTVGDVYFNLIGTQCFREDYPVTGCKLRGGILKSKCVEYEYDTAGEKRYQWFDLQDYRKD